MNVNAEEHLAAALIAPYALLAAEDLVAESLEAEARERLGAAHLGGHKVGVHAGEIIVRAWLDVRVRVGPAAKGRNGGRGRVPARWDFGSQSSDQSCAIELAEQKTAAK
jgi:hypothetical protein